MRKNSHIKKTSFKLLLFLIGLLAVEIVFGVEALKIVLMNIAFFVSAIFISGFAIIIGYYLFEIIINKKAKDVKPRDSL